jgi:MFS family permease
VPRQILLGTLTQASVIVAASLVGGRLSDRTGRRKTSVVTASVVYGLAVFAVAVASDFDGFLVGMAISGLGFGVSMAVDLAVVADVLPGEDNAEDLGVLDVAGALPFTVALVFAGRPGDRGRELRGAVCGRRVCVVLGAVAILPVRQAR